MKIQFQLVGDNREEFELFDEFCKLLVNNIKKDIFNSLPIEKLNSMEKFLINAKWINWIDKPTSINMSKLAKLIIKNIRCYKMKNDIYTIDINPLQLMPFSTNKLEQIARFLDRGNELSSGSHFINDIFIKYRLMINNYWNSYVSLKLARIRTSKIVIIE